MRVFWLLSAYYGCGCIGWWLRGIRESKKKEDLMRFYTNLLEAQTRGEK